MSTLWKDHQFPNLAGRVRSAGSSCSGQEMKLPDSATWEQLEPALPPVKSLARARAVDLVQGMLKECLYDPFRCLLPVEELLRKVLQCEGLS